MIGTAAIEPLSTGYRRASPTRNPGAGHFRNEVDLLTQLEAFGDLSQPVILAMNQRRRREERGKKDDRRQ